MDVDPGKVAIPKQRPSSVKSGSIKKIKPKKVWGGPVLEYVKDQHIEHGESHTKFARLKCAWALNSEFWANSTAHGFNRMVEGGNGFLRVLYWLGGMVGFGAIFCLLVFIPSFQTFLDKDVSTSVSYSSTDASAMDLPVISLCSNHPMRCDCWLWYDTDFVANLTNAGLMSPDQFQCWDPMQRAAAQASYTNGTLTQANDPCGDQEYFDFMEREGFDMKFEFTSSQDIIDGLVTDELVTIEDAYAYGMPDIYKSLQYCSYNVLTPAGKMELKQCTLAVQNMWPHFNCLLINRELPADGSTFWQSNPGEIFGVELMYIPIVNQARLDAYRPGAWNQNGLRLDIHMRNNDHADLSYEDGVNFNYNALYKYGNTAEARTISLIKFTAVNYTRLEGYGSSQCSNLETVRDRRACASECTHLFMAYKCDSFCSGTTMYDCELDVECDVNDLYNMPTETEKKMVSENGNKFDHLSRPKVLPSRGLNKQRTLTAPQRRRQERRKENARARRMKALNKADGDEEEDFGDEELTIESLGGAMDRAGVGSSLSDFPAEFLEPDTHSATFADCYLEHFDETSARCYKTCDEACPIKVIESDFSAGAPAMSFVSNVIDEMSYYYNETITEDMLGGAVLIKAFYETNRLTIVSESAAMPFESLMGNIGGNIGLWCGFSMMTFLEVIEFIVVILSIFFFGVAGSGANTLRRTNHKTKAVSQL